MKQPLLVQGMICHTLCRIVGRGIFLFVEKMVESNETL
nr:MAG TPA: hypothetical protein [Caudoviricetes sp.]